MWLLLALSALVSCGGKAKPDVPDPSESDNPILAVKTIGFYGVPGGDVVFGSGHSQISRIYSGGNLSFSIQNPSTISVASLSGLPENMKKGEKLSFIYKFSSYGVHTVMEEIADVAVLKVSADTVWLKKDDNTYFVLRK